MLLRNDIPLVIHGRPVLTPEQIERVAAHHEEIMELSGYDDPVIVISRIGDDALYGYEAPYSWMMETMFDSRLGIGLYSASVMLYNDDNEALWQKRSEHVRIGAGNWSSSAAGGVDPGESPLEAATRELVEELGAPLDAELLSCQGLIVDEAAHIIRVSFTAVVSNDYIDQVQLNEHEVSAVQWSAEPPGPISPLTRFIHDHVVGQ